MCPRGFIVGLLWFYYKLKLFVGVAFTEYSVNRLSATPQRGLLFARSAGVKVKKRFVILDSGVDPAG